MVQNSQARAPVPAAPNEWKGIEGVPVLTAAGVTRTAEGLIRVPYRLTDGRELNAKLIAPSGRAWWERTGTGLIPLGLETLPPPADGAESALLIAEGESDTLALRHAYGGTTAGNPVRGYYALGLPGAGTWRPEWRLVAEQFPVVYLIGDGDAVGRRMIGTVFGDVPWARPVWLPDGEDARSVLLRDGWRALDRYLGAADEVAKLAAAFRLSGTYDEFIRLLRGGEARDVA